MRMMKRMLTVVSSLLLALSLNISARAEGTGYTYKVRLFAGQQGTFADVTVTLQRGDQVLQLVPEASGSDTITLEGLMYGDRITFDISGDSIDMDAETKYYVRGIRESGKDNEDIDKNSGGKSRSASTGTTASFPVTGDADYVVGYGLFTDPVEYTVNYVDAAGNPLAQSRTFRANVGDRPVVAYLYIDGYQPQAYNMTGELKKDSSKNVFTFVYTPVGSGGIIYNTIVLPGTIIDLGTIVEGGGGAGAGGAGGGGGAAGGGGGAPENIPDAELPGAGGDTQPAEIENIDDGDVPLVDFVKDGVDNVVNVFGDAVMLFGGLPGVARIAIIAAFAAVVGMAIWSVVYFRGRKKDEE